MDLKQKLTEQVSSSPWSMFFQTLDKNENMSSRETMDLFAKTILKADSSWKDTNGNTVLMLASSRGETAIAKRLIEEFYLPVNAANNDGLTALHMAARGGHEHLCEYLLDKGANPCAITKDKVSAADLAKVNNHPDLVKTLEKAAKEKIIRNKLTSLSKTY